MFSQFIIFSSIVLQLPDSTTPDDIGNLLSKYSQHFSGSEFSISNKLGLIDSCFAPNSVEEIVEKLVIIHLIYLYFIKYGRWNVSYCFQ
jgi:hypothetical protein